MPRMIRPRKRAAFSLVEVVFSMGVVVFAGFALIGLLGMGIQNTRSARMELQAATLSEALCSTRRAAPTNDFTSPTGPQPNFPLPVLNTSANNLSAPTPIYLTWDGAKTTTTANAQFGFLYNITASGTSPGVATVYLCYYWPALAPPSSAAGHYEITTTFTLP